jgi:hypothetical protein
MPEKSAVPERLRAHGILVPLARGLAERYRADLDKWKFEGAKNFENPNWLWESLLGAFAVMGRSTGAQDLLWDQERHNQVSYDELKNISRRERKKTLIRTLRSARRLRMPDKKAKWLLTAFDYISIWMGGPANGKALLMAQPKLERKLDFLQLFEGIGPKSSRNMLMNAYLEPNTIAIDARIKSISKALGLSFPNYEDHQQFYLEVARDAGIDGWSLDRLMYNYTKEFLSGLASKKTRAA